jgi:predicted AAA+ superfamily ATPase
MLSGLPADMLVGPRACAKSTTAPAWCQPKGWEHEADIVLEYPDGSVVGIEVKATASPSFADARHLAWLRDSLGGLFAAGVVFHTGPRGFRLGDRIAALPISALWS